jgi:hypothetical protein
MNSETIGATGKASSKWGTCGCTFSGWKCPGCFDVLPAGASVCARCWNGKQR